MERYSARTINELGQLVLHGELRKKLGLDAGGSVSFALVGTLVIIQPIMDASETDCAVSKVTELGMIDLPRDMRQKLDWKPKDQVAVYHVDNMIIIKSAA